MCKRYSYMTYPWAYFCYYFPCRTTRPVPLFVFVKDLETTNKVLAAAYLSAKRNGVLYAA